MGCYGLLSLQYITIHNYFITVIFFSTINTINRKIFSTLLATALAAGPFFALAKTPNDPDFGRQTYLHKINAPMAWDTATGSNDVLIAVIDTGVDYTHPDLQQNMWINQSEVNGNDKDDDGNGYIDDIRGWDFISNDNDPRPVLAGKVSVDAVNHGTIIAGILAGQGDNYMGIAGVNWRAKIMPLRALDALGQGDIMLVKNALDYAVDKGADVINLSFVGLEDNEGILEDAIKRAYAAGAVIVAAAGNAPEGGKAYDLNETPHYPACFDSEGQNMVLGVAALDADDRKAEFSNYGAKCIDLSAVGVNMYSTAFYQKDDPNFSIRYGDEWSGTSLAAPLVAGSAALLKAAKPSLTNSEIYKLLIDNADNIDALNVQYKGKLGAGKVNLAKAMEALAGKEGGKDDKESNPSARLGASEAIEQESKSAVELGTSDGGKIDGQSFIVVAPKGDKEPLVRIFDKQGKLVKDFLAYAADFRGGVNLDSGDIDLDGRPEIVVGSGKGGGPQVRIFDLEGRLERQFFAFDNKLRGGVNVAVGQKLAGATLLIVAGAGAGMEPRVRIFDYKGNLETEFLIAESTWKDGVKVSLADVDGDGQAEILAAPQAGGKPLVKIFDLAGQLKKEFLAYAENFLGGVQVAVGDLDGDGNVEIITGTGKTGGPHVRIFNGQGGVKNQFFAYGKDFRGGVSVSAGDWDGESGLEIATAAGPGGGPHVRIFDIKGKVKTQFFAYEQSWHGGVNVEVVD